MKHRHLLIGAICSVLLCLSVLLFSSPGWTQAAQAAGPSRGAAAFAAGTAAAHAGRYAAAAHDFEQALLHGHTDPNTFYQLGLAYSKLKQWNDAAWALAMAASDAVFSATTPAVTSALTAASAAGGYDQGAPARLRGVTMTPMRITPQQEASIESRSVVQSLQGTTIYFVGPAFNRQITAYTAGPLTAAAADLQNNSNTGVRFVFLSATPAPYTSLGEYAKDLFAHLNMQRAVLVVITPQAASAYSDRLSAAVARGITATQRSDLGMRDPVALATAIARAVTQRADANDAAATQRSVLLGVGLAVILCATVAFAIWRIVRREPVPQRGMTPRHLGIGARSRVR
ncbi:MAG TPA: hypothetical protein VHB98_07210 [Chloroflexota bacterium]|nr:hypothetical protein [Chloroflexota bacterium]